MDRKV
jgi:hypothetical protein